MYLFEIQTYFQNLGNQESLNYNYLLLSISLSLPLSLLLSSSSSLSSSLSLSLLFWQTKHICLSLILGIYSIFKNTTQVAIIFHYLKWFTIIVQFITKPVLIGKFLDNWSQNQKIMTEVYQIWRSDYCCSIKTAALKNYIFTFSLHS